MLFPFYSHILCLQHDIRNFFAGNCGVGDSGLKMDAEKNNQVSKECIFTTIASEAAGLYNLLITLSTGMFGGTLLFLDRIAPSPTKKSLWFLGFGWGMLLFCTLACAWVRWKNLESGRLALEGKFEDARKVDKPNRMLTKLAIISLGLGISFIGIFAFVNIVHKVTVNERETKMVQEKDEHKETEEKKTEFKKLAIPYGSITPPQEEEPQSVDHTDSGEADASGSETDETSEDNSPNE